MTRREPLDAYRRNVESHVDADGWCTCKPSLGDPVGPRHPPGYTPGCRVALAALRLAEVIDGVTVDVRATEAVVAPQAVRRATTDDGEPRGMTHTSRSCSYRLPGERAVFFAAACPACAPETRCGVCAGPVSSLGRCVAWEALWDTYVGVSVGGEPRFASSGQAALMMVVHAELGASAHETEWHGVADEEWMTPLGTWHGSTFLPMVGDRVLRPDEVEAKRLTSQHPAGRPWLASDFADTWDAMCDTRGGPLVEW